MDPEVPGQSEAGQAQVILGLGVAREKKTEEQPENDQQGMNCEGFRGGKGGSSALKKYVNHSNSFVLCVITTPLFPCSPRPWQRLILCVCTFNIPLPGTRGTY